MLQRNRWSSLTLTPAKLFMCRRFAPYAARKCSYNLGFYRRGALLALPASYDIVKNLTETLLVSAHCKCLSCPNMLLHRINADCTSGTRNSCEGDFGPRLNRIAGPYGAHEAQCLLSLHCVLDAPAEVHNPRPEHRAAVCGGCGAQPGDGSPGAGPPWVSHCRQRRGQRRGVPAAGHRRLLGEGDEPGGV